MHERQSILSLAKRARSRREELYLATVVHVEGSSYRKPGALMLVTSGGERAGTISGGCLEAEVSRKIAWLTATGATVERYRSSFDDDNAGVPYGLGCGGTIWILMETGRAVSAIVEAMERAWMEEASCVVVASLAGDHIGTELILRGSTDSDYFHSAGVHDSPSKRLEGSLDGARHALKQGGVYSAVERSSNGLPVFVCIPIKPLPRVTVFGAGSDAQPLVRFAAEIGWRVSVADGRSHLLSRLRFPEADALQLLSYAAGENGSAKSLALTNGSALKKSRFDVILTHSYEQDRALLRELIPAGLAYLGLLGPLHRTERLVNEVAPSLGMTPTECLQQLNAPVGLDLGSDDPAVIALAIISEMQAALSGTRGFLERRYNESSPVQETFAASYRNHRSRRA